MTNSESTTGGRIGKIARAYHAVRRPLARTLKLADDMLEISMWRCFAAIGDRALPVEAPRLLLEAIRHFGEPVIQDDRIGRIVGYGETAMDCYFIIDINDGGRMWATCVGGTTFLTALKFQNLTWAWNGDVWSDFTRVQPYEDRNITRDLKEFVLELHHDDMEDGSRIVAATEDVPEPQYLQDGDLARVVEGVNWEAWKALSKEAQVLTRKGFSLTDQLRGLLGKTVEVEPYDPSDKLGNRRFVVGQSNGFAPISLELEHAGATHGRAAQHKYGSVRVVE